MKRSMLGIVAIGFAVLATSNIAKADSFTLTGPAAYGAQGFGNIAVILSLHANGTETGAVAPSTANNQTTLSTFGACSGSPVETCGNADNQSEVISAATLASLGITTASQFGLLYNVNQQGSNLNTYLNTNPAFTVYFYNSSGTEVYSATYTGGQTAFAPVYSSNGQGTSGWLFSLNGTDFTSFSTAGIAYVGMSAGPVGNSNDGADDWAVVNTGAGGPATVPEPGTLALFGTGALGLAGYLRRKLFA